MRAALLLCAALALWPTAQPAAERAPPPHHQHKILLLCAALAFWPTAQPAAECAVPPHHQHKSPTPPSPPPLRLDHIKRQILAKLGLSTRPVPHRAPPRDVVRQILARAADPTSAPTHDHEHSAREIIAIAHRDSFSNMDAAMKD